MQNKKLLYSLVFSFAWAFNIFFRKLALNQGAAPLPFLLHSSIVSVLLLSFYIFTRKRKTLSFFSSQRALRQFLLMGIFVGAAWVFDTIGLTLTTSINYSFIMKNGFIFSILLAFYFFRESITRKKLFLILFLLLGAYFITTKGESFLPAAGDLVVLGASLLYSSATIVQKFLTKKMDAEVIGWGRVTSALLILFLFMGATRQLDFTFVTPSYILLAGILLSFTTVFLNKALSVSSVSYLTMMTMTVPVINAVLGTAFLGERMNTYQLVGGSLIIIGGILANKFKI